MAMSTKRLIVNNTREALNILEYLGCEPLTPYNKNHRLIIVVDNEMTTADFTNIDDEAIDCGGNIEAFRSLMFLNSDDDYNQIFTDGNSVIRCDKMKNTDSSFHKMNVEEIRRYYEI